MDDPQPAPGRDETLQNAAGNANGQPPPDAVSSEDDGNPPDLVGGPFAVIESDPGVFTSLTRKLGVRHIEVVEMYDIEPYAVDHLKPRGLIFCFLWRKDAHRPGDFKDPSAEGIWFANQLSDDACATQALLNIVLNCPEIEVGEALNAFRMDTEHMAPVMKGLAIANAHFIREAHNSLARPCDLNGAIDVLASTTLSTKKTKPKDKDKSPVKAPPAKKRKTSTTSTSPSKPQDQQEVYHFIAYVPARGKVWELDGLKAGPLEVGELPDDGGGWMEVVRPAIKMKMRKYGGGEDGNIRFSLLALVDDAYERASDEMEMLKRERDALRAAMGDTLNAQVDQEVLNTAENAFCTSTRSGAERGTPFRPDFAHQAMQRKMAIQQTPPADLPAAFRACVNAALSAKMNVEDEVGKSAHAHKEHVKRTHDYEPFIAEFVRALHEGDMLDALLAGPGKGKNARGKGKG